MLIVSFDYRGLEVTAFLLFHVAINIDFLPCMLKTSDPKPSLNNTGSGLSPSSW